MKLKQKHVFFVPITWTEKTKPEHILMNALGGRKTSRAIICSDCNQKFGNTIDHEMAAQIVYIRNILQLESGTGNSPPEIINIQSGNIKIKLKSDGTPEQKRPPFTIQQIGDGTTSVQVNVNTLKDLKAILPNLAKALKLPEEELLRQMSTRDLVSVTQRPKSIHIPLSLGGTNAIRSMAKSCLCLWSCVVGNAEVKEEAYLQIRDFITNGGNNSFSKLDFTYNPLGRDIVIRNTVNFFNLLYIESDSKGCVYAHFTLYNIVSWQIILAEKGASPNKKIGLISNPPDTIEMVLTQ